MEENKIENNENIIETNEETITEYQKDNINEKDKNTVIETDKNQETKKETIIKKILNMLKKQKKVE